MKVFVTIVRYNSVSTHHIKIKSTLSGFFLYIGLKWCKLGRVRSTMNIQRQTIIRKSAITGLIANLILFTSKISIGLLTSTVSLISDAFNNLSDFASNLIGLISTKLALKPADEDHPYGHGRVEYIATQFVAFLVLWVGITLLVKSIKRIINPLPLEVSSIIFMVIALSIFLKLFLVLRNKQFYKQTQSDIIAALIVDSKYDVISSLFILVAMIIQFFVDLPIDGIAGFVISLIILKQGYDILNQSLSKLLGKQLSNDLIQIIDEVVASEQDVLGYHNLKGHDYGPNHIHVSIDLEMSDHLDLNTAHDIVDRIEKQIYQKTSADVVAHIDPISSDKELNQMMKELVLKYGENHITLKDIVKLFCVSGHLRTSVFITLSKQYEYKREALLQLFQEKAKEEGLDVSFHIEFQEKV